MSAVSYRSVLKTIMRSNIFRLATAVLFVTSISLSARTHFGNYDTNLNIYLWDNDPRYILGFRTYIKAVINICCNDILRTLAPSFVITTTLLVLRRDYRDDFYEIEKAYGVRPHRYLLSRLAALLTVNIPAVALAYFLNLHCYVFSRGGVKGLQFWQYISDSFVRAGRNILFIVIPSVVFWICLTLLSGHLLRGGILSAVGAFGNAIAFFAAALFFRNRVPQIYLDYISPVPQKIMWYFYYFDTPSLGNEFKEMIAGHGTSVETVIGCLSILFAMSGIMLAISYFLLRKRTI